MKICAEYLLLNLSFLKFSDVIYVLIVYICSCSARNNPCWILPSIREVERCTEVMQNILITYERKGKQIAHTLWGLFFFIP